MPGRFATSLVVAAGITAIAAGPAVAADHVTCSFAAPQATLAITLDDVESGTLVVTREGNSIRLLREEMIFTGGKEADRVQLTPIACSGPLATVTNTDRVQLSAPGFESPEIRISLAEGSFAPGATPEPDGTSEIEFIGAIGEFTEVHYVGTTGPDWFQLEGVADGGGINLNGFEEVNPDIDAAFSGEGSRAIQVSGRGGDDRITSAVDPGPRGRIAVLARGGAGDDTLEGTRLTSLLFGGKGEDRLVGGRRADFVFGQGGDDVIRSVGGNDQIDLGSGKDVVDAGGGRDEIRSFDGSRDRVGCRSGRDAVAHDRRDRLSACEVKILRKPKRG